MNQRDEVYPHYRMEEDLAMVRGERFSGNLTLEVLGRFARYGTGTYAEEAVIEIARHLSNGELNAAVNRWVFRQEGQAPDWLGEPATVAQQLVELGFEDVTSGWSLRMPAGDRFQEMARPYDADDSDLPPSEIALGRLALRAVLVQQIRSRSR